MGKLESLQLITEPDAETPLCRILPEYTCVHLWTWSDSTQ